MQLLAIPIFIIFSTLPGAWVAYGFPLQALRWPARLALGGALSPVVLAAQMMVLKAFGLPFTIIPTILLLINLPVIYFIWRSISQTQNAGEQPQRTQTQVGERVVLYGGGLFFAILALYLWLPWQFIQNLRPFAWHALWHTDISYALTRNTFLPEEPELAGLTLAYGWVGHAYWSIIGWSTNLPPTITYALSNGIWLLFTFLLVYELGITGLRLQRPTALLGVGLTFLGTNVIGALAWTVKRDWHWQQQYLGDIRYTPLLGKYLGFETMPFAFALLIAVALLCTLALRYHLPRLAAPLGITLTALGLIYPILFPVGCLLVGGLWLLLIIRLDPATPQYRWREVLWIAAGVGASVFIAFAFLTLVTQDRSNGAVSLTALAEMKPKFLHLVSALLLFVPAALAILLGLFKRSGPVLLLTAVGLGSMALYVVTSLDNLEYKYMLAVTIVAAPLAASGIEWFLLRWPKVQWGLAFATTITLVFIHQTLMFSVGAQIPENLVHAPMLQEDTFWVSLAPSEENAAWTTAVRTQTTENTVVVTQNSAIHISSFVARPLYAPSDIDGTESSGYSVDNRFNLLTWRGYPAQLYEERLAVVKTVYSATSTPELQAALTTLLLLNRPVAIDFARNIPMLQWLRDEGIGSELFADDTHVVWLLQPLTSNGENQHAAK